MKEEINEVEKELDIQFPKGDKARGRALIIVAMANIIKELALKEIYDRAVSPEWGDVQFRKWVRNNLKKHTREK